MRALLSPPAAASDARAGREVLVDFDGDDFAGGHGDFGDQGGVDAGRCPDLQPAVARVDFEILQLRGDGRVCSPSVPSLRVVMRNSRHE